MRRVIRMHQNRHHPHNHTETHTHSRITIQQQRHIIATDTPRVAHRMIVMAAVVMAVDMAAAVVMIAPLVRLLLPCHMPADLPIPVTLHPHPIHPAVRAQVWDIPVMRQRQVMAHGIRAVSWTAIARHLVATVAVVDLVRAPVHALARDPHALVHVHPLVPRLHPHHDHDHPHDRIDEKIQQNAVITRKTHPHHRPPTSSNPVNCHQARPPLQPHQNVIAIAQVNVIVNESVATHDHRRDQDHDQDREAEIRSQADTSKSKKIQRNEAKIQCHPIFHPTSHRIAHRLIAYQMFTINCLILPDSRSSCVLHVYLSHSSLLVFVILFETVEQLFLFLLFSCSSWLFSLLFSSVSFSFTRRRCLVLFHSARLPHSI